MNAFSAVLIAGITVAWVAWIGHVAVQHRSSEPDETE